jgi:GNAT superfamily N-acetyltransferase
LERIIPFSPELSDHFRDLNLDWLEQYFYVEPHDRELLDHCEEVIINKGGHIFFYQENDLVCGTFAIIKVTEDTYELGKMAVSKDARGKGIGQKMMRFCIDFAQQAGWKKLILYSNTSLENSIHIYRKSGFIEVPVEPNNPYARGNIKMEKILSRSKS